jgi:hypothetical protein
VSSTEFQVAGVTFRNDDGSDRQQILRSLLGRSLPFPLVLRRDPGNRYDANAIAICDEQGRQIGYVPREHAGTLASLLDRGVSAQAEAIQRSESRECIGLRVRIRVHEPPGAPAPQATGCLLLLGCALGSLLGLLVAFLY